VSSLTRQAWPHPIVRWPIYTLIEVTPSLAVPASGLPQPASLLPQIIDALFTILNHRSDTVLPRPDSTCFRGLSIFTHVPWFHNGATAVRFLSVTTSRPYALRQVINFTLEARFLGPCQRLILRDRSTVYRRPIPSSNCYLQLRIDKNGRGSSSHDLCIQVECFLSLQKGPHSIR